MHDPYEVLGLSEAASDDEIRAAYKQLTRQWHPDRFVGQPSEEQAAAGERMAEITGAFQLLNDPVAMARWRGVRRQDAGSTATRAEQPADPVRQEPSRSPRSERPFEYREAAAAEFYRRPAGARRGPDYSYTAGAGTRARPVPPPPPRPNRSTARGRREFTRRRGRDTARRLAAGMLVVLVVPLITLGVIRLLEMEQTSVTQAPGAGFGLRVGGVSLSQSLAVGHCFDAFMMEDEDGGRVRSTMVIPCSQPHESQVIGLVDVGTALGSDYPGRDAIVEHAQPSCRQAYPGAVGVPFGPGMPLALHFIFPSDGSWASGDRQVVCAVSSLDGAPLTGTAREVTGN